MGALLISVAISIRYRLTLESSFFASSFEPLQF